MSLFIDEYSANFKRFGFYIKPSSGAMLLCDDASELYSIFKMKQKAKMRKFFAFSCC